MYQGKSIDFTVYCDESRQGNPRHNPYMVIGGLWVPSGSKKEHTKALRELKNAIGLNGEIKWSKVSESKCSSYQKWVDYFFENEMNFRAIIVDQRQADYDTYLGGDEELGFYTFYFEMLVKWLHEGNRYNILLDFKKNREHDRPQRLKERLDKNTNGCFIKSLNVIDSSDSPIAQLADVLTGAVAAWRCGIDSESSKGKLAQYIADRDGRGSLDVVNSSPCFSKINLFSINLQ